ncbi:hypothetical protein HQN89_16945 [Paenibacillus frigoriresistens]|nr:hypothetical protein [Paenibacillus frigoriresistens]
MHGLVAIGMDGQVLRPAIIWCDQRSVAQKELIETMFSIEQLGELVQNRASTGFLLLSLLWLKQHEPETYEKIWKVMLPKDYIRYRLTGEVGTESTDASGTLAYEVANKRWSNELLGQLGIDPELLPTVREPWEVAGGLTTEAANDCAIPAGHLQRTTRDEDSCVLRMGIRNGEIVNWEIGMESCTEYNNFLDFYG